MKASRVLPLLIFAVITVAVGAAAQKIPVKVGVYKYKPFVYIDENGVVDGLYIKVIEHIAEKENWDLSYVRGSWAECLNNLESGKTDLLVAIAYSESRAKRFNFSQEIFLTNWGRIYTRKHVKIESMNDLAKKRLAVYKQGIFSESLKRILKEIGVHCDFVEVDNYESVLELLRNGKVDAGVLNHVYSLQLSRLDDISKTDIIFMPTELRFAAPKQKSSPLLDTIDKHIAALKSQKNSVYHRALNEWSLSRMADASKRFFIPPWLKYLFLGATGLIGLFSATSLLLKRQVRRQTLELVEKNELLNTKIEEKRKTEKALKENEQRLSNLMDNLPGMTYRCLCDRKRTLIFASSGCKKLLGLDPADLVRGAGCLREIIHSEDFPTVLEKQGGTECRGQGPGHYQIVYRVRTRDGSFKWVCDYGGIVEGEIGKEKPVLALEGFITDITSQQEEELRLRRENLQLKSVVKEGPGFGNIIGKSAPMQAVYDMILKAVSTEEPVIIYGESGTGKELVARAIHGLSPRSTKKFIPVNCGAIPENLLESEFFGHRKGAFTGAESDKIGLLRQADGGVLFLDEIGDIALNMQVKLLRAIEGGGFTPVGGSEVIAPDIRIVAATNRNLKQLVKSGKMREDFYYRIHVIPIQLPPLRDRKEDIPLLLNHFLKKYEPEKIPPITGNLIEAFKNYHWPGNVREFQNVLNRYVTLRKLDFAGGTVVRHPEIAKTDQPDKTVDPMPASPTTDSIPIQDLKQAVENFERRYLLTALEQNDWHRGKTAQMLNINRKTLFKKIQSHNLMQK